MQLPPPAGGGRASANALLWLLLLLLLTCFMAGRGVGAEDSLQFCAATVTYQGSGGPSDANFYGSFSLVSNLPRVRGAIRNPNLSPHTQALTRSRSGQNPGSTPFPPIFPHSVRGPFACLPPLSGSLVHPVPCPVQPCPACPTTLPVACLQRNITSWLLEWYFTAGERILNERDVFGDPNLGQVVLAQQPAPPGALSASAVATGTPIQAVAITSTPCHTHHTHTRGVLAGPALTKRPPNSSLQLGLHS